MDEERPLGELIREFVSTLGAYVRQNAAAAVNEALSRPLKRAAKKVLFLGFALGMSAAAAVMLALAFFNVLTELFGAKSAAYAATFAVCIILAGLCAWAVSRDVRKDAAELDGDGDEPEEPVEPDPGEDY